MTSDDTSSNFDIFEVDGYLVDTHENIYINNRKEKTFLDLFDQDIV